MHQQKLQQYMQKHLENQMIEWKQKNNNGTFLEYIQEVSIESLPVHNIGGVIVFVTFRLSF
jgi:hypothetical protein